MSTTPYSVRLPVELGERVAAVSRAERRSFSNAVAVLLEEALAGRDEAVAPSGGDQSLGSSRAAGGLTSPAAAVESRPASVSGAEPGETGFPGGGEAQTGAESAPVMLSGGATQHPAGKRSYAPDLKKGKK